MTVPEWKHVYELYIRTSPAALWRAMTDPEWTTKYFYGTRVESTFAPGAPLRYIDADDGQLMLDGAVVECVPEKRLVASFVFAHHPEGRHDRPSRVTWEIEKRGSVCKLTVTHDEFEGETATYRGTKSGWNPVLSGLKTLVETGEPLRIPPAS